MGHNKEYYSKNREQILEQKRLYNLKNKEQIAIKRRERYQRKKEEILKANKLWRQLNKKTYAKTKIKYYLSHREQSKESSRKSVLKLKIETFSHYSDGNIKCACCGEREIKFLALDHINGGGGKERRETRSKGGQKTYRLLRKNNYPTGYQILCHNCNMAKGFWGECPHNPLASGIKSL